MQTLLEQLSRRQLIWQGSAVRTNTAVTPSGYAEFDATLGGWPEHGLVTLQSIPAIGELRLVLPALVALQQQGLVCFINPPQQLHAEPLLAAGLQLSHILLLEQLSAADALWAAEQILRSGLFKVVLLWQTQLAPIAARRLQLVAEQQQALLFQFTQQAAITALPVALALQLEPSAEGLQIRVHKRRGHWPGQVFSVSFISHWPMCYTKQQVISTALDATG